MAASRSLGARAAVAVVLMAGFYLLAVAVAAFLVWVPYADWRFLGRIHPQLALACLAGAAALLWSIVPRPDRFEPPGPPLTGEHAPRLLGVIRDVARAVGQPAPADIYLVNEVNAWVTHRGGVMGLGSRRVMGIGLPLLTELREDELRAVIAHEFGHYIAGDVSLGPWIYKTRAALGRTLAATDERWFAGLFRWYSRLFMRTTQAISREQEFAADRVAARVAGAEAAARALDRVAILAPAHTLYMRDEVVPALNSGHLPPLAEGFRRFLTGTPVAGLVEGVREQAWGEEAGEFDSHPPLRERVEALGFDAARLAAAVAGHAAAGPPVPWLDPDRHAREWLAFVMGRDAFAGLRAISWEDTGTAVFAPQWEAAVRDHAGAFGARTAGDLPEGQAGFAAVGRTVLDPSAGASVEEAAHVGLRLIVYGLGVVLVRHGWAMRSQPGEPVVVERDGETINPWLEADALLQGRTSAAEWRARATALGIAEAPFVPPAPAAGTPSG